MTKSVDFFNHHVVDNDPQPGDQIHMTVVLQVGHANDMAVYVLDGDEDVDSVARRGDKLLSDSQIATLFPVLFKKLTIRS